MDPANSELTSRNSSSISPICIDITAGGNESPVSAKYCADTGAFAFNMSIAGGKDRVDDDKLSSAGECGEGKGE